MLKLLSAQAPAKINLFLRITGRRPDGYHELDSVFVPVSLFDHIALALRPSTDTSISLRCDTEGLGPEEKNLAVRAARAFMTEFGISGQLRIDLKKTIPFGAGLGGGSSDAGTVLRMLSQLCGFDDNARLAAIAVKLGADVPFFLDPRASRVRGIGEIIEPIARFASIPLVIAVPSVTVPTVEVFRRLKPEAWTGAAPEESIGEISAGRIDQTMLVNDLAGVAMGQWPEIARLRDRLNQAGAIAAAMSGSGGAVFGIFASPNDAENAAATIRREDQSARAFAVSTLERLTQAAFDS